MTAMETSDLESSDQVLHRSARQALSRGLASFCGEYFDISFLLSHLTLLDIFKILAKTKPQSRSRTGQSQASKVLGDSKDRADLTLSLRRVPTYFVEKHKKPELR